MAKSKIPVLTEVYTPKKSEKATKAVDTSLALTPELLEKVSTQIRPMLEAEIKGALLGEMRTEMSMVREELGSPTEVKDTGLSELRAEMQLMREELSASTQGLVDGSATEAPKDLVPEITAKVSAQVKPKLEAEITDFVLDELRGEIKKARAEIIASTEDFVDKTKADLKTEMPKTYQKSVDLAEIDLTKKFEGLQADATAKIDEALASVTTITEQIEALQQQLLAQHQSELNDSFRDLQRTVSESMQSEMHEELRVVQDEAIQGHQAQLMEALDGFIQIQGEKAENTLIQKIQAHHGMLRQEHEELLAKEMAAASESITQRVDESTQEQVDLMYTQVGTIQQETFAKLREAFNAEKESAFNAAAQDVQNAFTNQMTEQSEEVRSQFLAKVNADLPDVQKVLQERIDMMLASAVPDMEGRLKEQLTADLQALLLKVKFVLPD